MHQGNFQPQGIESLLITSVDAATAGQNALLAAESLGYNGVMVGLIRDQSSEISKVLNLPDYTYPIFGIALGKAARLNKVKPRLPLKQQLLKKNMLSKRLKPLKNMTKFKKNMLEIDA